MRTILAAVMAICAASVAVAAPRVSPTPGEVRDLIAADNAENLLCRGYSQQVSDTACRRRDELEKQIEARGWCWGPDDAIEADSRWMRAGPTCHINGRPS